MSKYFKYWIILGFFLVLLNFFSLFIYAQEIDKSYVFLGNENIPPMLFLQNSKPTGLIVDLANSLAVKSGINMEIKLMDWTEAQSKVSAEEADALLQINKNPEREKIYDFSENLLKSDFCIFRKNERVDIQNINALFGYTVGVEASGYPLTILKKYPQIKVQIIDSWAEGFKLINEKEIEAVIVDKWVGEHELYINDVKGIKIVYPPVETSYSAIAVKKGNRQLLTKINRGLAKINQDGTRKKILKKWSREQVSYLSQEQFNYLLFSIALIFLVLLLFLINIYIYHIKKVNHKLYLSTRQMKQANQQIKQEIEERKRAEQILKENEISLRQAKLIAETANRAKDTFLAHISHELRTPLNSILGFSQVLKKDSNLKESQHQHLDSIYESGKHLLILINDILDLSKITAQKLTLELKNFYFPTFLNNIINIAHLQSQQKGIDFHYQLLFSPPQVVCGDETRLRQVLLNLLNNAVKFTKAGSVTFTVSSIEDTQKIRFQVQDTGVGIPAEQLSTIFLPFEQLPNNHSNEQGTGLGLAITSNLVRLMDSQIKVKSTLGEGSTFWFDLDLLTVDTKDVCITIEREYQFIGYQGRQRKILVVDDNLNNRQVFIDWLKPLGFKLKEAENGQQGLALVSSFQPDLILLDLVMPIMNGVEMATRVKQDSQFREIPIFAISANAQFTKDIHDNQSLFDAFLSKPVDLNQLLDLLEAYLGLKWITAESTENDINISTQSILIPEAKQLEELLNLAEIGDIVQVIAQAESLETINEQYSLFTQRVKQLGQNFQLEKLIALLENNLNK